MSGVTCQFAGARILRNDRDQNLDWRCEIIRTVPHDYASRAPVVTGVSLQPRGRQIAITGDDHYVCIYNIAEKEFAVHLDDLSDWVRATRALGSSSQSR